MRALGAFAIGVILAAAVAAAGAGQDEKRIATGKQMFETYCATCHGASAAGDGVLARVLRRRPADLTQFSKAAGGQFPGDTVYKAIAGTSRASGSDMPAWGDVFTKTQDGGGPDGVKLKIQALVDYVETVQAK